MPIVPLPIEVEFAPYRLSGVVYGTLLNHRPAIAAIGAAVNELPYKAAPAAPVLYQKPGNTLATDGASVVVPAEANELELGVALGVVIKRTACRVRAAQALDYVAGYIAVADICIPHGIFYRPSLRFRARDGFCVLAPAATPESAIANPDTLAIKVLVDGDLAQESTTGDRVRSVSHLLEDVTDFMTLSPGDILMTGVSAGAAKVKAGQRAQVDIAGLSPINICFVAEGSAQ